MDCDQTSDRGFIRRRDVLPRRHTDHFPAPGHDRDFDDADRGSLDPQVGHRLAADTAQAEPPLGVGCGQGYAREDLGGASRPSFAEEPVVLDFAYRQRPQPQVLRPEGRRSPLPAPGSPGARGSGRRTGSAQTEATLTVAPTTGLPSRSNTRPSIGMSSTTRRVRSRLVAGSSGSEKATTKPSALTSTRYSGLAGFANSDVATEKRYWPSAPLVARQEWGGICPCIRPIKYSFAPATGRSLASTTRP